MDLSHYRFRSVWRLKAVPERVYQILQDIDRYPLWWPEVRGVDRVDDDTVRITVRSLLPYDLVFLASRSQQDPRSGTLETTMHGDLDGFSRWTIAGEGPGTRATFEEQVIARKRLLRSLALVARPVFQLNHAVMMRHGRRRLPVYLAGYDAGYLAAAGPSAG